MAKTTYKVWIAFKDCKGNLYDKSVIAVFYSNARAVDYLKHCKETEDPDFVQFGIE